MHPSLRCSSDTATCIYVTRMFGACQSPVTQAAPQRIVGHRRRLDRSQHVPETYYHDASGVDEASCARVSPVLPQYPRATAWTAYHLRRPRLSQPEPHEQRTRPTKGVAHGMSLPSFGTCRRGAHTPTHTHTHTTTHSQATCRNHESGTGVASVHLTTFTLDTQELLHALLAPAFMLALAPRRFNARQRNVRVHVGRACHCIAVQNAREVSVLILQPCNA